MTDTSTDAGTMTPLRPENLDEIAARVPVPAYDRSKVSTGIVHIGVGGFHRAHQAMYVDALMNRVAEDQTSDDDDALSWGITGVGLLPGDKKMAGVMAEQEGLYTLLVKEPDGTMHPRVIGSIIDYLFAPDRPEEVLDAMTDPATRIVSMTITEGGYHVHQVTGDFDPEDEGIQQDLEPGATPSTAFGFLTEALARRRSAGVPPFTVMSCDNLAGNGDITRRMVTAFATLRDRELGEWIDEHVDFPTSMVDRITPVTREEDCAQLAEEFGIDDGWPVACEPFAQWALEDIFGPDSRRPAFEQVGVQVVSDVEPYELMKLRLLNASHQALCYLGYLAGYRYAHEVCADPLFREFLIGYMEHEGSPTLPPVPDIDLDHYRHQLVERFANPEIRDTLARLCAYSSDRIPNWLVPVIREQIGSGGEVRRSALVVAAWARYAEGVDEQGESIDVVDNRRDQVMARAREQSDDPLAFVRDDDLFGDLADQSAFTEPYLEALDSLHEHGAVATLKAWQEG